MVITRGDKIGDLTRSTEPSVKMDMIGAIHILRVLFLSLARLDSPLG